MFVCTYEHARTHVFVCVCARECVCGGGGGGGGGRCTWMCMHVCVFVMCVYTYSAEQHAKLECAHSSQAHERDPTSASICIILPSVICSSVVMIKFIMVKIGFQSPRQHIEV